MKAGDRIQITLPCRVKGYLGVIIKENIDFHINQMYDVVLDSDPHGLRRYFRADEMQVMSAFNYAPNPVPPAPKPITFRFTKNPVAHVTLVPDGPRWIVRDCHDDKYRGVSYASMEEFLMIHNDSGVYESTGLPPKQCKHQWKERILFISIEDYCALCGEYKARKAS